MFQDLLEHLLGLPPLPAYALIGALAGIENIFPPLPADTAVALGAFLAGAGGSLSVWGVFLVTWSANVLTAAGVYLGARAAGRPLLRTRVGQRLLKPAALARIEGLYARYGVWGIFLSRFIPGVRAVVPPFAGLAGLDATRAIVPMALASALWYGAIIWIAATLLRRLDDVASLVMRVNQVGLALVAVILALAVALLLGRRRRKGREHDASRLEGP